MLANDGYAAVPGMQHLYTQTSALSVTLEGPGGGGGPSVPLFSGAGSLDFVGRVESLPTDWTKLMRAMARREGVEPPPEAVASLQLQPPPSVSADGSQAGVQADAAPPTTTTSAEATSIRRARAAALLVGRTEGPNQVSATKSHSIAPNLMFEMDPASSGILTSAPMYQLWYPQEKPSKAASNAQHAVCEFYRQDFGACFGYAMPLDCRTALFPKK